MSAPRRVECDPYERDSNASNRGLQALPVWSARDAEMLAADQPLNAARVEALGVGRTLDARRATSEIDALPGPESTVALLERM
jgi:hypothetical protein